VEVVERLVAGSATPAEVEAARLAAAAAVEVARLEAEIAGVAADFWNTVGQHAAFARLCGAEAALALFSREALVPEGHLPGRRGRSFCNLVLFGMRHAGYAGILAPEPGQHPEPVVHAASAADEEAWHAEEAACQAAVARDIFGAYLDGRAGDGGRGGAGPCRAWPVPSTKGVPSSAYRSWGTPWKRRDAPTGSSCTTAAAAGPTCRGAG
jgi:hypothetical protein